MRNFASRMIMPSSKVNGPEKTAMKDTKECNLVLNGPLNVNLTIGPNTFSTGKDGKGKLTDSALSMKSWDEVIQKCSVAVVKIQVCQRKSFGDTDASIYFGTGFVVHLENDKVDGKGYILTNAHIIGLGPNSATATFSNKQCVDLKIEYVDPIHDYGFYSFDMKDISEMKNLVPISLAPEEAKVGLEFRLIGNSEGSENAIISGTINNLREVASSYTYADYNTFYIEAITTAKPGSSGSPIIAPTGNAVALQSKGAINGNASAFMPIIQAKKVLNLLKLKKLIKRGCLHCGFDFAYWNSAPNVSKSRQPETNNYLEGFLVVNELIKDGAADKAGLKQGDVLIAVKVNNMYEKVDDFDKLHAILDDNVRKTLSFKFTSLKSDFQTFKEVDIEIQDLTRTIPQQYLEISNAILHSYTAITALRHNIPLNSALLLADAGFMFDLAGIQKDTLITKINEENLTSVAEAARIFDKLKDGDEVTVTTLDSTGNTRTFVVAVDKTWTPTTFATYDSSTQKWWAKETFARRDETLNPALCLPKSDLPLVQSDVVTECFVEIETCCPLTIEGNMFPGKMKGHGLVVDVERGLILSTRTLVRSHLADTQVIFNMTKAISATVLFLHPEFNLAILKFNPSEILADNIKISEVSISSEECSLGDKLFFVGLSKEAAMSSGLCNVVGKETQDYLPKSLLLNAILNFPRNETFLNFDIMQTLKAMTIGIFFQATDLFADDYTGKRKACAFLFRYLTGSCIVPSANILQCVKLVQTALEPSFTKSSLNSNIFSTANNICIKSLGLFLTTEKIRKVRKACEMPDTLIKELSNPKQEILQIVRTMRYSNAAKVLKVGDLIIKINGNIVTDYEAFNKIFNDMTLSNGKDSKTTVDLEILRGKSMLTFQGIQTEDLMGFSVNRVLCIHGLVLHDSFDLLRYHIQETKSQKSVLNNRRHIFISQIMPGSPADHAKLSYGNFIIEINGKDIKTLDDVLEAFSNRKSKMSVIVVMNMQGQEKTKFLKPDEVFFMPRQYSYRNGSWYCEKL